MSNQMIRKASMDAGVEAPTQETVATLQSGTWERTEAGTKRKFIKARPEYMEGHINGLALIAQNKRRPAFPMSADGIRAIEAALCQVLKFTPVPRHEQVRTERGIKLVRRTDITNCKLPKCLCTGGVEHYELPVDALLNTIRESMQGIVSATEAEEAHVNACVADGLACTLGSHAITINVRKIWKQVKPETVVRVSQEEAQRYLAWDGRWKFTGHYTDGTVDIAFDHFYLFDRAKNLEVEQAAREKPRSIVPPAGWLPLKEVPAVE